MSNALTLGVVGHVDHGKTALVKALTGIETDRLREERERGLSIVLGFAFLETAHGVVDLIDVPGHEDFVRAMIGGATALDGIVLCVAANEGVMPQTKEHLNIARLLGVERGFVAVTKSDAVEQGTLDLVIEDIADFVRGTFLESSPAISVSARTGAGVEDIRAALDDVTAVAVERQRTDRFFLPLDRVFTMRGFGLVGTGTLRGGDLNVGDAVEIMPVGRKATVRALQNHNEPVERAVPGQRVAVNLRHVDREEIRRGHVLAAPGSVRPSFRVDANLHLLADANPVRNGMTVRVLTGTTEAIAKLRLLDRRELGSGESAMVQLDLDRPVATRPSEHYLIRSYSPMHTIGGGRILAVDAERHRRYDPAVAVRLETVATGNLDRIVEQRLAESGARAVNLPSLVEELGVSTERIFAALEKQRIVRIGNDLLVAEEAFDALLDEVVTVLTESHRVAPFRSGMTISGLISRLGSNPESNVARHGVESLVERGDINRESDLLSLAGFDPFAALTDAQRTLAGDIESGFLQGGLEPPAPSVLVGAGEANQAVFRLLLDAGRLVRLRTYKNQSELVLHAKAVKDARQAIRREFPYPRAFALKDIRDLLGSTRKYIVPLMEHFDATGETVRSGDQRRLREH